MSQQFVQDPAVWGLVIGIPVATVATVRNRKAIATLRRSAASLQQSITDRDEEISHLVEHRLSALMDGEDPGPLHRELEGTDFARSVALATQLLANSFEEARSSADQAAQRALKSAMRTLQSLAVEQQQDISDMQAQYGDSPEIFEQLLALDHTNSQFARRAQTVAVLCGGWTGRQRNPATVYDVTRSAVGRIRDYLRVEILSQGNVMVSRSVVEPLALVLAELLDNCASYSPPDKKIYVNIDPVANGVSIMIDDAGIGMDAETKRKAGQLLSGEVPVGVTRLGAIPQFGFAVIGMLARQFKFSVSVDSQSPYGGVRAVIFLPRELFAPVEQVPAPVAAADRPAAQAVPTGANGLPRRSRKEYSGMPPGATPSVPAPRTAPAAAPMPAPAPAPAASETTAQITSSTMGAFQRGMERGRSTEPMDE
jgi:signal transduction histidine kinase